jgi:hypothetical protein
MSEPQLDNEIFYALLRRRPEALIYDAHLSINIGEDDQSNAR